MTSTTITPRLTRITINPASDIRRTIMRSPEAIHAIIAAIADGSRRPLYRVEGDRIYLLAEQVDEGTIMAKLARPDVTGIDYTPLLDRLDKGQTWGFSITANPTTGHVGTHTPITSPDKALAWLGRKLAMAGAGMGEARIIGWHTLRFHKKGADLALHTMDVQGVLTVTDPDLLRAAITGGVGRGKAYGCGLLLLCRAN